jgi:hypothetical protein
MAEIGRRPGPSARCQLVYRLVEVAAVEEVGQRVTDGQLLHLGMQEGVGQRQGRVAGQQLHRLALDRAKGVVRVLTGDGDGPDHDAIANQRHPRTQHRRRLGPLPIGGRPVFGREVAVDDNGAVADGASGQPFARPHLASRL